MVNNEKLHDDERRKIGTVSSLRPRRPQASTYGPVGRATAGDQEAYEKLHRPLVPSDEYKFDQMSKMMDEVSARLVEAAKPENIIACLNDEITELKEKIAKQQWKISALSSSEEPLQNVQLEITMREGKIANYQLKIAKREKSIAIVKEKGELPLKPFVYKSKFRDLTKKRAEEVQDVLK